MAVLALGICAIVAVVASAFQGRDLMSLATLILGALAGYYLAHD